MGLDMRPERSAPRRDDCPDAAADCRGNQKYGGSVGQAAVEDAAFGSEASRPRRPDPEGYDNRTGHEQAEHHASCPRRGHLRPKGRRDRRSVSKLADCELHRLSVAESTALVRVRHLEEAVAELRQDLFARPGRPGQARAYRV